MSIITKDDIIAIQNTILDYIETYGWKPINKSFKVVKLSMLKAYIGDKIQCDIDPVFRGLFNKDFLSFLCDLPCLEYYMHFGLDCVRNISSVSRLLPIPNVCLCFPYNKVILDEVIMDPFEKIKRIYEKCVSIRYSTELSTCNQPALKDISLPLLPYSPTSPQDSPVSPTYTPTSLDHSQTSSTYIVPSILDSPTSPTHASSSFNVSASSPAYYPTSSSAAIRAKNFMAETDGLKKKLIETEREFSERQVIDLKRIRELKDKLNDTEQALLVSNTSLREKEAMIEKLSKIMTEKEIERSDLIEKKEKYKKQQNILETALKCTKEKSQKLLAEKDVENQKKDELLASKKDEFRERLEQVVNQKTDELQRGYQIKKEMLDEKDKQIEQIKEFCNQLVEIREDKYLKTLAEKYHQLLELEEKINELLEVREDGLHIKDPFAWKKRPQIKAEVDDGANDVTSTTISTPDTNSTEVTASSSKLSKRPTKKQKLADETDDGSIEAVGGNLDYLDPFTKKPIVTPMKNRDCGHVYDLDSILTRVRQYKDNCLGTRHGMVPCPVCSKKNVSLENLAQYPQLFD